MINSIRYFEEESSQRFEEISINFLKNPKDMAGFINNLQQELYLLGIQMVKETLETADRLLCESPVRKHDWYVDRHEDKALITSFGTVNFSKTLFKNKASGERTYLLDELMGIDSHERITEDAKVRILEEVVETSYRRGGEAVSVMDDVTKQTVMNLLHGLQFARDDEKPEKKRVVQYLYVEADEDHLSLQYRNEKGDLQTNEYGQKNNNLISKLVYVHEGIKPESILNVGTESEHPSKRKKLINPHYFARVCNGKENDLFWEEIIAWMSAHYDLTKVEKVYLNADGGTWIKSGAELLANMTHVLDGFHLQKYILKLTGHMKDSTDDARRELYAAIRNDDTREFKRICRRLKDCLETEAGEARIDEAKRYILNNWQAARIRLCREVGVIGSSTEGHVYHALSSRMSTKPMGWSVLGASKMVELRAYVLNDGDVLELVRYQKQEVKMAVGAEYMVSAGDIITSERNEHEMIGKYYEAIHRSFVQDRWLQKYELALMGANLY